MYQLKIMHEDTSMPSNKGTMVVQICNKSEADLYLKLYKNIVRYQCTEYEPTYADVLDRFRGFNIDTVEKICTYYELNSSKFIDDLDDLRIGRKSYDDYVKYNVSSNLCNLLIFKINEITFSNQMGLRWFERNSNKN